MADALERIAAVAEMQALGAGSRNSLLSLRTDAGTDESYVAYVDDAVMAKEEEKREAYYRRTGIALEPGVEPPSHAPGDKRWQND